MSTTIYLGQEIPGPLSFPEPLPEGVLLPRDGFVPPQLTVEIRGKNRPSVVLDLGSLAREANFRPGSFYQKIGHPSWTVRRCVKAAHQMSVQELLTKLKLEEAKFLLLAGVPTKTVAASLSYHDSVHFHHDFKRRTGQTPGQFVRAHRTD